MILTLMIVVLFLGSRYRMGVCELFTFRWRRQMDGINYV